MMTLADLPPVLVSRVSDGLDHGDNELALLPHSLWESSTVFLSSIGRFDLLSVTVNANQDDSLRIASVCILGD